VEVKKKSSIPSARRHRALARMISNSFHTNNNLRFAQCTMHGALSRLATVFFACHLPSNQTLTNICHRQTWSSAMRSRQTLTSI
jgi:hypothetical protein